MSNSRYVERNDLSFREFIVIGIEQNVLSFRIKGIAIIQKLSAIYINGFRRVLSAQFSD
jgi:hypothetical protein